MAAGRAALEGGGLQLARGVRRARHREGVVAPGGCRRPRGNRAAPEGSWVPGMTGWRLIALGALCGAVMLWVFRRATDLEALRVAGKRMLAHLTEFRLFFDEPWLIWRAQKALIAANLRLLALVLPPALILALPSVWLFAGLDSIY